MEATTKNTKTHFFASITLGFTGIAGFNLWHGDLPNDDGTFPVNLWKPIYRANAHMNGEDVIGTLSNGSGGWEHGVAIKVLKRKEVKNILNLSGSEWQDFKNSHFPNKDEYKGKNFVIEMQCYVSSDKNRVVGYVRNRTYNLYTNSTGDICNTTATGLYPLDRLLNLKWDYNYYEGSLKIENLRLAKKYRTDFYSIQENYINTDEKITSAFGKLKLRYPELYIEENWQNRPVIWFVSYTNDAKSMGINGSSATPANVLLSNKYFKEAIDIQSRNDTTVTSEIIKIYPNPAKNYFVVESPQKDQIIIQSTSGSSLKYVQVKNGSNRIDISSLSPGLYILHFKQQNKNFKIIIK